MLGRDRADGGGNSTCKKEQRLAIDCGPLRGEYDSVLCLTDLETDDCLALQMLSTRCAAVPFTVITGEGDQDKAGLASHILGAYGYRSACVARGSRSARSYPAEVLGAYDLAGAACPAPINDTEDTTEIIRRTLEAAVNPLVIVLKPPLELLADGALDVLPLRKCALAAYGSFNFRRVLEEYPEDGEMRLRALLSACRCSLVVERARAVGSAAVLDSTNVAPAFATIRHSPLGPVMAAWNAIAAQNLSASVAQDSADLMLAAASSPPDYTALEQLSVRIARRAGVCRCIGAADGQQIAAADPIIAALLLEPACLPSGGSGGKPLMRQCVFAIDIHSGLVWQPIDEGGSEPTDLGRRAANGAIYCLMAGKSDHQMVMTCICGAINRACTAAAASGGAGGGGGGSVDDQV